MKEAGVFASFPGATFTLCKVAGDLPDLASLPCLLPPLPGPTAGTRGEPSAPVAAPRSPQGRAWSQRQALWRVRQRDELLQSNLNANVSTEKLEMTERAELGTEFRGHFQSPPLLARHLFPGVLPS